jgi:aspartate carbamoyltransferase catalytic subunit
MNLFFEASTRTRTSFELAARRLGAEVVNFDIASSSTSKGESLEDTEATLEAMDADAFVVRHRENGTPDRFARHARRAAVVNAGDGNHAHPTQGLLDLLTIRDRRGDVEGLNVTICGDVRHSRVARSDVDGLTALGAGEIRLCGPAALLPVSGEFPGCRLVENFDEALDSADVVVMLRLQKERMQSALGVDEAGYFAAYGLTSKRLARAKSDAIVMHPGPMNRGIEIADDVADGPQSVILDQVANGIFVRMAVLAELLGER